MSKIESAYAYLYDIFPREDIDAVINRLEKTVGISAKDSDKQPQNQKSVAVEKRTTWTITDLDSFLNMCEKTATDMALPINCDLMKKAITRIDVFGIDNDNLPYYILLMVVIIDPSKLGQTKLFEDVPHITHPIRVYFDQFNGIHKKLALYMPSTPCLLYFGLVSPTKELAVTWDMCKKLSEAYQTNEPSLRRKLILEHSDKIRKTIPLNSIRYDIMPITALPIATNVIAFTGYWNQDYAGGMNTPFIVAFSDTKDFVSQLMSGLSAQLFPSSSTIYYPDFGSSFLISLLCVKTWLEHLIKIVRTNSLFPHIRKGIDDSINSNDKKGLKKQLMGLNKAGSDVANLSASLSEFELFIEPKINELLNNQIKWPEQLPVISSSTYRDQVFGVSNDKSFLEMIGITIREKLDELSRLLNQQDSEYEKFSRYVSNIINLNYQESEEGHTRATKLASYVIIGLTVVLIGISIHEYQLTNFPPIVEPPQGGDIYPNLGNYPGFSMPKGITISSISPHFLKFTVTGVKLTDLNEPYAKCFFVGGPNVTLWRQSSIILNKDSDLKQLDPDFTINYRENPTFQYGLNNNTSTGGQVTLGHVSFDLDIQDLQEMTNTYHKQADSTLVAKLPPNLYDYLTHCK